MRGVSDKLLVLEGSQCYQIEQHTGPMDEHHLWICKYLVEGPEIIKAMHTDYLRAGSDVLLSVSYQTSIDGLQKCYGYSVPEAMEKIQYSVTLARNAWEEFLKDVPPGKRQPAIVGGSAGPYGATLHDGSEYTGSYLDNISEEFLIDWHRPRVKALVDAGVDFIAFETLPSVVEGSAVVRLMREFPNHRAWVSFNCKDGASTARGEPFGKCLQDCWNLSNGELLAVGLNCTQPFYVSELLKQAPTSVPLVVYPNSGEVYDPSQGWTGTPMDLGLLAPEWIGCGAKFLGGCCRTRVSDIVGIRAAVDAANAAS